MMAVKQNKNQDLAILSTSVIKCAFCSYNTSYNSQVGIDFEYRFLARHYKTHTERDVRFACYGCDKLHYDISHVSTVDSGNSKCLNSKQSLISKHFW